MGAELTFAPRGEVRNGSVLYIRRYIHRDISFYVSFLVHLICSPSWHAPCCVAPPPPHGAVVGWGQKSLTASRPLSNQDCCAEQWGSRFTVAQHLCVYGPQEPRISLLC